MYKRQEGKPLKLINGKPMIERVYNQCSLVESLDKVIVLTDDDRIQEFCEENSIPCLRVDDDCETGTDRCAKAIESIEADFFVNIQGDEPVIDPGSIDLLIKNFLGNDISANVFSRSEIRIGNAYTEIKDDKKLKQNHFEPSEWLPFAKICRRCTINAMQKQQRRGSNRCCRCY